MKAEKFSNQLAITFALTMMMVLLTGKISFGQTSKEEAKKYNRMIENLKVGIQSNNEGVRRDCIYLAGKYEYTEVVEVLIDALKQEKNPKNRALIALALYRIGDEKGIKAVYEVSLVETDAKVKHTCKAIVDEFKSAKAVAVNE